MEEKILDEFVENINYYCRKHKGEINRFCDHCLAEWGKCREHGKVMVFCGSCFDKFLLLPAFKDEEEKKEYAEKLKLKEIRPEDEKH